MIFTCACPGDASCRNFSWLFPLLNVLYGFLVLKIAGLKLNASNFHKFSLNWFWIAQFWACCTTEQAVRAVCGAVKCTKSLVICFVLCLLRQLLSALILSHWGKRRTFIIHFYYKRNLIFPKAHKLYASQEFHFGMKINTTSISINIPLVSAWSAGSMLPRALIILPPVQKKECKGENVGEIMFHVPYSAAQSTMRYVVFSEGSNSAS